VLAALLGSLACAGALAIVDQWVTPAITPVLIGSMAVSLVFLMRPVVAVLLFGAAGGVIVWGLGLTQANPAMLLSNRVNALSGLLMGVALSMLLWHKSGVQALLRRELQASNQQLRRQQAELQRLAVLDPLTGVINRREFERVFRHELVRAQRMGGTTSLVAVDLDHFKAVNDRHGHPVGDLVLQQVAHKLTALLRRYDVLARYGGEEFMILLPQTDLPAALAVAEKLRAAVQAMALRVDGVAPGAVAPHLTVSLGVATSTPTLREFEQLYARADQALYEAKRRGRNQVASLAADA
jgi:diguanylate cyclase (GGDEF)-like protein